MNAHASTRKPQRRSATRNPRAARPSPRARAAGRADERVFARLRADHHRVLAAAAATERALRAGAARARRATDRRGETAGIASLRTLVRLLGIQFETHLVAEDEVLFPLLARAMPGGESFVRPLHAEHVELRAVREAIAEALTRAPGAERDEQLLVQARDLVDLLRIHIRKEEALVFGIARRLLTAGELAGLASRRTPATRTEPRRPSRSPITKGKQS